MINFGIKTVLTVGLILFITSCGFNNQQLADNIQSKNQVFLIGNKPNLTETVNKMIEKSGIRNGGYVAIISTSFQVRDSYAKSLTKEFNMQGVKAVHMLTFLPVSPNKSLPASLNNTDVLTIENARILCILNGNRNKFMKLANNTRLKKALLSALENGTLIAGIGNGASIFGDNYFIQFTDQKSKKKKTVLKPGLGLLKNTIVDNIAFLKGHQKRIRKETTEKNFLFIGMGNKSSVGIYNSEAVVLSKTEISLVRPDSNVVKLGFGNVFSLLPE